MCLTRIYTWKVNKERKNYKHTRNETKRDAIISIVIIVVYFIFVVIVLLIV